MATIKLCDWTGERLSKEEVTYQVIVDGEEFEVGSTGKLLLMEQLEGDTQVIAPSVVPVQVLGTPLTHANAPPQPPEASEASDGTESIEEPTAYSEPVQVVDDTPLEIHEDLNKRLPKPTAKQSEQVLLDSKVGEKYGLSTLTPGNPQQRLAAKKLKEEVAASEAEYQGSGDGFNISDPLKGPRR